MKKVFLKRLLATCISCLVVYGIVWACAGGDWDDSDNSGFTPEAFVDSTYRPFFLSSEQMYYGVGYDDTHISRFNNVIVKEWQGFFNNTVTADELELLLISASVSQIDSVVAFVNGSYKKAPAGFDNLSLLRQKNNDKIKSFFSYLSVAKKCEAFSTNKIAEWWSDDTKNKKAPDVAAMKPLVTTLTNVLAKQHDPFLRERYWFQLVRLNYFQAAWKNCIASFDANKNEFPKNDMYYRAMAYMAGAYYKQAKYGAANYYYSLVFKGCDALKIVAHWSFHPQEEKDCNQTLSMCASNEEKITLWQMLGIFYGDETRSIGEIYKLNPASDALNLLLVRTVNKAEQSFNFYNDYGSLYGDPSDKKNAGDLQLVTKIAEANNTNKPNLWYMACGYLSFLNGNGAMADKYYAKASKIMTKNDLEKDQLHILEISAKVARVQKIDAAFEKSVLADFEWLSTMKGTEYPSLRYGSLWSWIKFTMAKKYARQKEWVKSECFKHGSDFYNDETKIASLLAFKKNQQLPSYDKFCANLSQYKEEDIYHYLAVRKTLQGKLDEAIAFMKQVPGATDIVMPGNPFNGFIKDCHDCDHEAKQKVKYNALSLLVKMKEMQDSIDAGKNVFINARLLGNAYYNITHFGNARMFYESNNIYQGAYSPYSLDSVFRVILTDMGNAKRCYNAAFTAATTDEQKALSSYMLAKCERNQWFNVVYYADKKTEWETTSVDFVAWPAFKTLKSQYSNTAYYKEVIKECGWFSTYVKQSGGK